MRERPKACAAWDEDLSALIDGELDAARESALRAHLEGCDSCRERLATLRRVDARLATPLPRVSPELRDRVLRGPAAEPRPARRAPPRSRRWLAAPLVAAAAAAALALYLVVRPPETDPQETIAEQPPSLEDLEPLEQPPTLIAEPLPPPPMPPPPEPEIPGFVPELPLPDEVLAGQAVPTPGEQLARAPAAEDLADLEDEPAEDLAVVLFGAEEPDDVDVIANLEILEQLLAWEEGRG